MSDDIVALLRAGHCTYHNGRIAADEIVRLRAEVARRGEIIERLTADRDGLLALLARIADHDRLAPGIARIIDAHMLARKERK